MRDQLAVVGRALHQGLAGSRVSSLKRRCVDLGGVSSDSEALATAARALGVGVGALLELDLGRLGGAVVGLLLGVVRRVLDRIGHLDHDLVLGVFLVGLFRDDLVVLVVEVVNAPVQVSLQFFLVKGVLDWMQEKHCFIGTDR